MTTTKDLIAPVAIRALTPEEVKLVAGGPGGFPVLGQQPAGEQAPSAIIAEERQSLPAF